MSDDVVIHHDHLNGEFWGFAHNRCNLEAKNTFVQMYAYIVSNSNNHQFVSLDNISKTLSDKECIAINKPG